MGTTAVAWRRNKNLSLDGVFALKAHIPKGTVLCCLKKLALTPPIGGNMHVVLAGGSGYVGANLCKHFGDNETQVTVLTRQNPDQVSLDLFKRYAVNPQRLRVISYHDYHGEGDVFINLAGESLGAKPINQRRLKTLDSSRCNLLHSLLNYPTLPPIFLQASAVACYQDSPEWQDEKSPTNLQSDFGAMVGHLESAAQELTQHFPLERLYLLRLGIVLSRDGGLIRKLKHIPPFKMMRGENYVPFIAIEDVIQAIETLLTCRIPSGPVNLVSPQIATFNELLACCFKDSRMPTIPMMNWFLNIGDRRAQLVQADQKIKPSVLLNAGMHFVKADIQTI